MDGPMKRILLPLTLGVALVAQAGAALADVITLKSGYPDSYVVQKGDTLWDISAHFLNDPWRWPNLWGNNPQIANPHLIYPGDKLSLIFIDGQPRLVHKPVVRKSPEGRAQPKGDAVPTVDLALIQPYLIQNRVVDAAWFKQQPLLLGGETASRHHVAGQQVYVDGSLPVGQKVGFYTGGRVFNREGDGETLGQEAILTATGQVVASGDLSTVMLKTSFRETKPGNRLLALDDSALLPVYFVPKAAEVSEPTKILASGIDIREMGKLDVVYIDRGAVDGVTQGDVFAIFRDGDEVVIDKDGIPVPSADRSSYDKVLATISDTSTYQLPANYHGNLMVFKVFNNTALGLIMVNERPVRVNDRLETPKPPLLGE
ncbi:MAG: LysM peptidoglycan-binding domain-containing protein [Shewanella sp.]|nr:LysM peptidoglycan-binding domain-containing protein [Shewanella sp.]MCF1431248.1 LysM peptidoglycan-binding domain-containing protein [Shewanella sp.]MCF1437869.1 LysM peptidoglycan-binding domain-containing protein [Shewanella sp.]MCF1457323.1 LysM peptidoglycan-binding domain-containing protein [Shewanella sp.]